MKLKPKENQLKYLSWEFGIFLHFGIRTYCHGHHDWDERAMDAALFNPTELDCDQWMREIKLAGARYAILTTKHHDGFALWPSAYTKYSVASSGWRGGKGDVVREFTDACRRAGLGCGLYYSPAQWGGEINFSDEKAYDEYFIGQMTELLDGRYGTIDYLWLDGAFSGEHRYDTDRIVGVIRKLQPDILIFGLDDPDVYGVGNEDGYVDTRNFYTKTICRFGKEKTSFLAAEGDCRLRDSWFYDLNPQSIKSVDELIGMYESTVGRGANFLLNIGPNEKGLLAEEDVARLHELAAEIRKRYLIPLPFDPVTINKDGKYEISYSKETYGMISDTVNLPLVRRVVIEEDISEGESVKEWRLIATIPSKYPYIDWEVCLCEGHGIGHKHICTLPAIRAPRFKLEILDHDGDYKIKSMKAFS